MSLLRIVLCGGLGNQLFQFAAGYTFSKQTGATIILDTRSGFESDNIYRRNYELGIFTALNSFPKDSRPSFPVRIWLRARNRSLFNTQFIARSLGVIDEKLHGNKIKNGLKVGGTNFVGFWQDENFFNDQKEALKNIFTVNIPKAPENEVAVHVRRVDYKRGVPEFYFEKALVEMKRRNRDCYFHLFTDDTQWGIEFASRYPEMKLKSESNSCGIDDFKKLTSYQNFIISNSTYSWWAALLGEKDNSIIICPSSEWWSNPSTPPTRWHKISVSD